MKLTHEELNLVLQECPESPYFATDEFETTKAQAKSLVLEMIDRAKFGDLQPLPEASQSQEKSSLSNHSVSMM